jgi:2,3,4,5-tetrahydropyridine-2-carboxylate N-succinyltransferase
VRVREQQDRAASIADEENAHQYTHYVEGVVIEENAVLSMGVYIGQSTKIYDRETGEIHYGRVPAGSVVVPGSLPSACGKYSLYAAIIVKKVDAQTRAKTAINELLRD